MGKKNNHSSNEFTLEVKQAFLASAITDISTYIQLSDTKVSIIMGTTVALIASVFSWYDHIQEFFTQFAMVSIRSYIICIFLIFDFVSVLAVFILGIITIHGHSPNLKYRSKWFLPQTSKEYSFISYKKDVCSMTDKDIIENMAAELYKLNDINRKKSATTNWTIRCFAASLIFSIVILAIILFT